MAFFFLRKTVFIVTGTNRALVTGFFFICDLKEREHLEHGAKWQISLKKVRKNPLIFCMLITVPLFANSNSWGTNLGSETSLQRVDRLQTFIQISRRHFVKNQVTCVRYFGHMIKVSRTLCHSLLSFLVCVLRSDEVKFSRYMFVSIDRFLY